MQKFGIILRPESGQIIRQSFNLPFELDGAEVLAAQESPKLVAASGRRVGKTRATAFRQGFLSTITNPKPLLFFATYLPQFVDPNARVAPQVFALGAFHCLVGAIWLTTYANLVGRLQPVLARERVRRRLERATGTVLIALGLRVALSRG